MYDKIVNYDIINVNKFRGLGGEFMIVHIVLSIIILSASGILVYKLCKKLQNIYEKTFYIFFVIVETFLILLYYFDRYNIPTFLKWNENVDTQNWLSILSSSGINILTEILGGLILVFVTIMQLRKTLDDNHQRDIEDRRINNMPLLSYRVNNYYLDNEKHHVLYTIYDNEITTQISLFLKNIGMNTVRDCYIEIDSKSMKKTFCSRLQEQGCIDKGEEKNINYLLNLSPGDHIFKITVYYGDLVNNWYFKKIELLFSVTNIFASIGTNCSIIDFKVYDEKKLKGKPKKLNKF